jgi:AraC-like DNA-binding protein
MKHLSNAYPFQPSFFQPSFGDKKIIISDSPKYTTGLDVAHYTKFFFFKHKPEKFLVDFVEQKFEASNVCVVPSTHLYFLSPKIQSPFFCMDIHDSLLNSRDLHYLHSLKFVKQKVLRFSQKETSLFDTLECLWTKQFDEEHYFNYFKNLIVPESSMGTSHRTTLRNIVLISQFLEHLKKIELKLDNCTVARMANELNCSEKTLLRACLSSFGMSTKEVLKYNILLKGIYMLSRGEYNISTIAEKLGFSSVGSFDKCVKRFTNQTPKKIQNELFSLGF